MKIDSLLSRIALSSVLVALIGIAFNAVALALFAAACTTLISLIAAGDYSRGPAYSDSLVYAARRRYTLPLAA